LGEPDFSDGLAFAGFHPGPGSEAGAVEAADNVACEEAIFVGKDEDQPDVEQQRRGGAVFLRAGGEGDGRGAAFFGPVAAGDVGDGKERFPDVGGAVVQARRRLGFGVCDSESVFGCELCTEEAQVRRVEEF